MSESDTEYPVVHFNPTQAEVFNELLQTWVAAQKEEATARNAFHNFCRAMADGPYRVARSEDGILLLQDVPVEEPDAESDDET